MQALNEALRAVFPPEQLKLSLTDRYAMAGDAGFYHFIPQAVIMPVTESDIREIFRLAHHLHIPVTFRAAGTSLSGQSVTDGILVDLSRFWKKATPLEDGAAILVQPGVIGAQVNRILLPFGRKMGPDPASISAAMMGGILSNNSSGMCCGVQYNSYHTLQSLRFVLTNGHAYDTAIAEDRQRFVTEEREIADGLLGLKKRLTEAPGSVSEIRRKYRIKNTVGYCINALLDYDHPIDILAHLLIGAEGTLAFISHAVLQTIPDKPCKSTGLLFFENPVTAAAAIPSLVASGAEALELMDRPALRSIEHLPECPAMIRDLHGDATAILCEYQGISAADLAQKLAQAMPILDQLALTGRYPFSENPDVQAKLWKLRKGLYPSVAAVRARGTTALLEDVAVPVEHLGNAVKDLQQLFVQFNYQDAIIFGHAKEGNLHFLLTQPVNTEADLSVFADFNEALADLIIRKYGGSLKAEHGTGRQIAPFVLDEWGEEIYSVMEAVKQLLDPAGILNPGVLLNRDRKSHLQHIKTLPAVEEEVDKCVECGYCENRCPSRSFTLTPRQRIQLRRAMQRLKSAGDTATLQQLQKEYQYAGMDTCAVDGMCATDCPVAINTGELIKRLRRENHSPLSNRIAVLTARYFGGMEWMVKLGLRMGNRINRITGSHTMHGITAGMKKMFPAFPLWTKSITKPVSIRPQETASPDIVYFPSCITRMMGADSTDPMPMDELVRELCRRAGLQLKIAGDTAGTCCGQLYSSKGFLPAYRTKVNETIETLWQWTGGGKAPVLMDVTSCTHSLHTSEPYLTEENKQRFRAMQFIDSIDFAADHLLPKLQVTQPKQHIVFHPVCTSYKMQQIPKLKAIAQACALQSDIPAQAGCCGMAGDRGFYYPGLTISATKDEAGEVLLKNETAMYDGCYSSGKTCEMAMQEATGLNYRSVLYLLRDTTSAMTG